MTDWRSLAAWALTSYVAHWLAMALLWIRPDSPSIDLSPFGPRAFGGDPRYGLAAAVVLGLVPRLGPVLWIAAGLCAIELSVFRRSIAIDATLAAGIVLIAAGVWRSGKGWAAAILATFLPLAFVRAVSLPWQFASVIVAAILIGGSIIAVLTTRKRPRWQNSTISPRWPVAAALVIATASIAGQSWLDKSREANHAAAMAELKRPDPNAPYTKDYFHKGVSFTAEGGASYENPASIAMLRQLPAYGVDAIALIPYGFVPRDGKSIRKAPKRGNLESEDGIEILAAEAHKLGMRVMLKPHVWRLQGKPAMARAEALEWLKEYKPYIEHYSRFAEKIHADTFCIGTELRALTQQEAEWRDIIAAVRAVYRGPITYAANHGEEFETIKFWDAVDFVGIDNYYPLEDDYGAKKLLAVIEKVQQKFAKPVVFTEAGYGAHIESHKAPWEDETEKPLDLEEQARSYEALLNAVKDKPWFHGVYWWKVGTNGYGGPDNNSMTPWRKPAMEVVKRFYASLPGK